MFRNYQELFVGFVDFYQTSLNGDNQGQNDLLENFTPDSSLMNTTSPLLTFNYRSMRPTKKALGLGLMNINNYLIGAKRVSSTISPAIGSRQFDENGREVTIGSFNSLIADDIVYILVIFINLVLAKRYLSNKLHNNSYLDKLKLRQKDRERLSESIWRLIFYSFSSTWLICTCFLKHQAQLLFNPNQTFSEYSFKVDLDEYFICMIETAFYLHATYALVFEDVWRRDSPMMLIHHLAAIFSMLSIYATRTLRIGLASVVLRDTCDVLLEITKLAMCFRIQQGKVVKSLELPIKFFFTIFTLAFTINQLYYYPLFCLYHGLNVIKVHKLQTPVMIGILTCGLIFLLLDLLWFLLILRLLYRMLFSTGRLEDLREYDEDDEAQQHQQVGSDLEKVKSE